MPKLHRHDWLDLTDACFCVHALTGPGSAHTLCALTRPGATRPRISGPPGRWRLSRKTWNVQFRGEPPHRQRSAEWTPFGLAL